MGRRLRQSSRREYPGGDVGQTVRPQGGRTGRTSPFGPRAARGSPDIAAGTLGPYRHPLGPHPRKDTKASVSPIGPSATPPGPSAPGLLVVEPGRVTRSRA
ncbi:hypothetical protein GCM10010234_36540 [Streptomyces hawaiiensis]